MKTTTESALERMKAATALGGVIAAGILAVLLIIQTVGI